MNYIVQLKYNVLNIKSHDKGTYFMYVYQSRQACETLSICKSIQEKIMTEKCLFRI